MAAGHRWNSFFKKTNKQSDRKTAQSVRNGFGQDGLERTGELLSQRSRGDAGSAPGLAAAGGGSWSLGRRSARNGASAAVGVHCRQWTLLWIKTALGVGGSVWDADTNVGTEQRGDKRRDEQYDPLPFSPRVLLRVFGSGLDVISWELVRHLLLL